MPRGPREWGWLPSAQAQCGWLQHSHIFMSLIPACRHSFFGEENYQRVREEGGEDGKDEEDGVLGG